MQRVQNLAVFFLDLHSGNLLLTIKLFTVWSSRLGCKKGFVKYCPRVPQAVGLYCSCHAAQASKGNFQKTF